MGLSSRAEPETEANFLGLSISYYLLVYSYRQERREDKTKKFIHMSHHPRRFSAELSDGNLFNIPRFPAPTVTMAHMASL